MYESFYKFGSNPFRLAPDPKFTFSHPSYDKANAYLEYALNLSEGFVIVTGRPGTGKTTLINTFLRSHKITQVVAAKVAVPNLNADDLLRAVAYAYEIAVEGMDMASVLRRLEQFFIKQVRAGKRILLIIDEAQGLSRCALEELRMLADMQTESRFLVQIFLVGQEKLLEHMVVSEMEQFQQRVTGTCKLEPLDLRQTRDYVEYRLCQAGWVGDPELTGSAVHAIYQYSNGIPRHINKICARLLLLQGMVENKHVLDESDVLEVAQGFKDEQLAPLQSAQTVINEAVGTIGVVGSVAPITTYAELALRAPSKTTEKRTGRSSGSVKPDLRNRVESRTRSALVSEHREPKRKREKYNALWIPAVAIGGLLGVTLLLTLVFYEVNQGDVSDLWTSREDAYEWEWVYEEVPVNEEPGATAVPKQQIAVSAVQETGQVPAEHYESVHVRASEPEKVVPAMSVTPIAESTGVANFNRSTSGDAGGEAASVASLESRVVAESEPVELKPAQPQPGLARDDEQHSVTGNYEPMIALVPADASTEGEDTSPVTDVPVVQEVRPEPEHVVATYSREEKVSRLLLLASESLRKNRLLIPADNNAYAYYLQVKALDPDNAAAARGMDRIAARYTLLAEQALDRDDIKMANRYIERGLHVSADNSNLLALQTAMLPAPSEGNLSVPPNAVHQSPVESRTLLSRLKEIFDKNQSEITAPPIWDDEEDTW